jgi:hypothetical protein
MKKEIKEETEDNDMIHTIYNRRDKNGIYKVNRRMERFE